MGKRKTVVPVERIEKAILIIRGHKVMPDQDLAELYGVETRRLNEQVKRNIERFPEDFMFRLTKKEFDSLKSHFAISSSGWGGRRTLPYAFTEHGAVMAANVLNSPRAIKMSVFVVRAFIKLREMAIKSRELARRVSQLEKRLGEHDEAILEIVRELRRLIEAPKPTGRPRQIGFISKRRDAK